MSADILIIEDNYADIRILEGILDEAGYAVRVARDGKSGLRAARALPPDLILLDMMLPDQDGYHVCQVMRDDPQLAEVPVVFISALYDASLKAQAFAAGAHDYITKPFNSTEVRVRVQHQLERVLLRQQLQENARLQERQHIARELHDSVNQTLFIMSALVQGLVQEAETLPAEVRDQVASINALSQSVMAEMRALLNELHPAQIANTSIQKLLHQLVDAFRLRVNADISIIVADAELPQDIKLVFYRITQEALNNVAKYAGAMHLSVHFLETDSGYRLLIEDDGRGFDTAAISEGMGRHTMRERAEQHGMGFSLDSAPGQGTRIEVYWPPLS